MGDLITIGLFATGLPVFLGILMAYALVSIILGAFLWSGKSIPDDVGTAVVASGIVISLILGLGAILIRFALS